MVECTGLENRRTARYRGFESLHLRKNDKKPRAYATGFFVPYKLEAQTKLIYGLSNPGALFYKHRQRPADTPYI